MRISHRSLVALALLLFTFFMTASAQAVVLAPRVFMSTTGNDSNNCANPNHPCLTFAGSLAQVAAGGEVIAETTGGYGTINVTKSVTISGPPGVVIFSGFTVTVNAPGANVVLRGLTIDGAGATGSGVNVVAVSVLHVESCVITGFAGTVSNGNGIFFTSAGQLFVKDTAIRGNAYVGVWVTPSSGAAQASLDNCRLEQNEFGLVVNASSGTATATIRASVASGNAGIGLVAEHGGELNSEGCLVANNDSVGLESFDGSILRASNCTVTDNSFGLITASGGALLSRSNNTVEGNGADGAFTGTYAAK